MAKKEGIVAAIIVGIAAMFGKVALEATTKNIMKTIVKQGTRNIPRYEYKHSSLGIHNIPNITRMASITEQRSLEKTTLSILDDSSIRLSKLDNPTLYKKYPRLETLLNNKQSFGSDKLLVDDLTIILFKKYPEKYYNFSFIPKFKKTVEDVLFKELDLIKNSVQKELLSRNITKEKLNTMSLKDREIVFKNMLDDMAEKQSFKWRYNDDNLLVNESFDLISIKYKISMMGLLLGSMSNDNQKGSLEFMIDEKRESELQERLWVVLD